MSNKFADILLVHDRSDFKDRLRDLRNAIINASRFEPGSSEAQKVAQIIRDVYKNGDRAVSEYTCKFDNVTLVPNEFQVSSDELDKAHQQIDRDLLTSLKKAISIGFDPGQPPSIMSMPSSSSLRAIFSLSSFVKEMSSDCVPSRKLVS